MSKCYLCGQTLVDRPVDYTLNKDKYENLAIKHEEHIIQNAIYGRLTDSEILCEKCGGKLSTEIDADFNKIFHGITEQLKHILASKDHGNNNFNRTLKGYIFKQDKTKIEVHIKEGKVVPIKPDYDFVATENKVLIYCSQKTAKHYQNKVKQELTAKGIDISKISIEIIDDISNTGELGIFFSEGIENFNSKIKLGLNKIATGFAVANGIDRTQLPCTLDIDNQKIIFTSNVVPFYPYSALDVTIEPFRVVVEDNFPTHTLILYTDNFSKNKKLVCYIDLFSTFQFYVILNQDFKGEDIQKVYYQTVLKQEKPKLNIRNTRMKFLSIIAESIGVSFDELKGKSVEDIYTYLETKYNQFTVSYELDLDEYIKDISNKASMNLLIKKSGITSHLGDIEREILEATPEMEIDDISAMYYELNRIESEEQLNYRQNFVEMTDKLEPVLYSTLYKMIELNNADPNIFKSYGHFKFYQLTQFIKMNEPKK